MLSHLFFLVAVCLNGAFAGLVPRQEGCSFTLSAIGTPNGSVVIDTIGENRIGGDYPRGYYHFNSTTLFDELDHNLIITPGSYQLRSVRGAVGVPTSFLIADDYNLLHNGCATWLACRANGTGAGDSYNIFTEKKPNKTGCQVIALRAGAFGCSALGGPSISDSSSAPPPAVTSTSSTIKPTDTTSSASGLFVVTNTSSTVQSTASTTSTSGLFAVTSISYTITPTVSASSTSGLFAATNTSSSTSTSSTSIALLQACPTDISSGRFLAPSLIIPTSPNASTHAFGPSLSAYVSPLNTTLFNFAIPSSFPYNYTCGLIFLFPFGGATYFSGTEEEEGEHGGLDFSLLVQVANNDTTYDTTGDTAEEYGKVEVLPGDNYTIASYDCQAGETVTYMVESRGEVELDWKQQSGGNPMGIFVVPCDWTDG